MYVLECSDSEGYQSFIIVDNMGTDRPWATVYMERKDDESSWIVTYGTSIYRGMSQDEVVSQLANQLDGTPFGGWQFMREDWFLHFGDYGRLFTQINLKSGSIRGTNVLIASPPSDIKTKMGRLLWAVCAMNHNIGNEKPE